MTEDGATTHLSLRGEDVSDKLEVFCFSARRAETLTLSDRYDDVQFGDFRIDQVRVCRRAEWLDSSEAPVDGVGENAQEQRYGTPEEAPPWTSHALVDAGLVFVDKRGSTLQLQADAFPMVIQCRYSVSSGQVPCGDERDIALS